MKTNTKARAPEVHTHEGARAYPHLTKIQQLRRSVLSCLLWEREFYEDGAEIAKRISDLAADVAPRDLAALAIEARGRFNLRHVPLHLLVALVKHRHGTALVSDTIAEVIQRADELAELLAMYWKANPAPAGKKHAPIPAQMKKGLARAFGKFDGYQLGKYNRDHAIKLRDVLFLVHAKPEGGPRAALYKQVADNALATPDTWEVALSSGADKKATWERLLRHGKLGYLALLRNLRNMVQADVDKELIRDTILARRGGAERVLPFRYIAAARACPQLEPTLDAALAAAIADLPAFPGRTVVMVDVSSSMRAKLSERSDLTRMDAAAALASIINGDVRMFSFTDNVVEVPPRRGMAGVDAIIKSQPYRGTHLFDAVDQINRTVPYDRLIVITDEQATDTAAYSRGMLQGVITRMPDPITRGYVINVASAKNGVGYGKWVHIDGFSENVIRYIAEHEAAR